GGDPGYRSPWVDADVTRSPERAEDTIARDRRLLEGLAGGQHTRDRSPACRELLDHGDLLREPRDEQRAGSRGPEPGLACEAQPKPPGPRSELEGVAGLCLDVGVTEVPDRRPGRAHAALDDRHAQPAVDRVDRVGESDDPGPHDGEVDASI